MNDRNKLIYIYNRNQAKFYINECNVKYVDIGFHKGEQKVYVIFVRKETDEAYKKWLVHIGKTLRKE